MKKFICLKLVCLFIGILFIYACSDDSDGKRDDENGEDIFYDLSGLYSNKTLPSEQSGELKLTYSGEILLGKEVYFQMDSSSSTANMTFYNVFPGETEVIIKSITFTKSDSVYTFNGQSQTLGGTSFQLSGSAHKNQLQLTLNNIKIPDNELTQHGTFRMMNFEQVDAWTGEDNSIHTHVDMPFSLFWQVTLLNGQTETLMDGSDVFLQSIVSKILFLMLPDLSFNPDGNITASYAPLSDDLNILNLVLGQVSKDDREEIQVSPINLVNYYVKNNSVYVRPNIEMIISLVQTNKTRAEEEGDVEGSLDLEKILQLLEEIYPSLERWTTEGIRFNLKENDPSEAIDYGYGLYYHFSGDYNLYLDEKELEPILYILSVLPEFIDLNIDIEGLSLDFTELFERIKYTSSLQLGLYLNKGI